MARLIDLFFPAANPQALLTTTVAGGGATTSIPVNNPYPFIFQNFTRSITLTSTDDLSGNNFTITGTDGFGNVISEVLVGPNNSTVTSANNYNTITNIAASAAYTNFSIGSGSTGVSQWIKVNTFSVDGLVTIQTDVVGTIEYTINETSDNLGSYQPVGPWFHYVQPLAPILLADNPIATVNTSAIVTVTVPSTVGLSTGDILTISGATETQGITAVQLNISASIIVINGTEFTYTSNGTATGTGSGGGAVVTYTYPPLPESFPVDMNLTNATTSQRISGLYPPTAYQAVIESSSGGGALTLTILQQGII